MSNTVTITSTVSTSPKRSTSQRRSTSSTDSGAESISVEEAWLAETDELIETFKENTFTLLDTRVVFSPSLRKQYYDRSRQLLEKIYHLRSATEPVGPKKLKGLLERFKKILDHGPMYNLSEIHPLRLDDLFLELMSSILIDNLDLQKMARCKNERSFELGPFLEAVSEQIRKIHESCVIYLTGTFHERVNLLLITEYMKYAGCLVFVLDFLVGSTEPFTMKPKESRISCEVQDALATVPEILVNEPDSLATVPDILVNTVSLFLIPTLLFTVLILIQYLLTFSII